MARFAGGKPADLLGMRQLATVLAILTLVMLFVELSGCANGGTGDDTPLVIVPRAVTANANAPGGPGVPVSPGPSGCTTPFNGTLIGGCADVSQIKTICNDGSGSCSTGSGTCSGHGGVCRTL